MDLFLRITDGQEKLVSNSFICKSYRHNLLQYTVQWARVVLGAVVE